MKKLFFAFIIALVSLAAKAQSTETKETHKIYAIVVMDVPDKNPAIIITEATTSGNSWSGFDFKSNFLKDEDGNDIRFNNFLPLLGYLQSVGWTIPDIEEQIYKNQANAVSGRSVFLIYKEVPVDEWLEWIENGKVKKKK